MGEVSKDRVEKLLESFKKELFAEFDEKIEAAQKELAGKVSDEMVKQTSSDIETYIEEQVEEEVAYQMEVQERLHEKVQRNFKKFQERLQQYHVVYAFLVAAGFMLFWYGVWQVLGRVEIFKDGILALGIGLVLLFITGAMYKKLVG
jgi:hypothetical protein